MKPNRRTGVLAPCLSTVLVLCIGTTLTACITPDGGEPAIPPPPRLTTEPWTDDFESSALLLADRIEIAGPDRIAERFVAIQDSENVSIEIETTPQGLRQVYRVTGTGAHARGQLDGWEVHATRVLVVLQQPGEVDVAIRATGNAFFQAVGEPPSEPVRGPVLEFEGTVDWPDRR